VATLPWLHEALEIAPRSSLLESNLGVIYCALGEDRTAKEAFASAVKAYPGAATSYTNLAAVSFNLYEYEEAEMSARQALRLNPMFPQAEVMVGLAEVAQKHWTREARKYLEDTRSQFRPAEVLLEHWPAEDTAAAAHVEVKGAGPGAFALASRSVPATSRKPDRTRPLRLS